MNGDPMLSVLRFSCHTAVWLCLTLLIAACVQISVFPSAVLAAAIMFFENRSEQ